MVVKLVIFCLKLQINKIKFTYFLFEMLKCIFEINEIDEIFKKNNFFRSLHLKKIFFARVYYHIRRITLFSQYIYFFF